MTVTLPVRPCCLSATDCIMATARRLSISSRVDTVIHKLSFTENGTDYIASGSVSGRPLNQYSLGEYQDYLRIATSVRVPPIMVLIPASLYTAILSFNNFSS